MLPPDASLAASRGDVGALVGVFDVNARDEEGWSLLERATHGGHCAVQHFLIERGADVNDVDDTGNTPLHLVRPRGAATAAVLLDAGAEVDAADENGVTPLMRAVIDSHLSLVRLLLSRGADLRARARDGRDVEDYAYAYNRNTAVNALLAGVRRAGGYGPFARAPREELLALRVLCERGRAAPRAFECSAGAGVLERCFPWSPPARCSPEARHSRKLVGAVIRDRRVFWLILSYWRCKRDSAF